MKVISQETFDEIVLENVQDFDNPLEEAIEEAVKEFEAQGINLGNIVKNMRISDDKERITHDVLENLETLKKGPSLSTEEMLSSLKIIYEECKLTLAHRVLATKYDAYNILLGVIKENKKYPEILAATLDALSALSMTNPDILNQEGINIMVDLFGDFSSVQNPTIAESLTKWCLESCLKHEKNRQYLVQAEIPRYMVELLKNSKNGDRQNLKLICKALRAFTLDDDIRAEFGKAHDHARMLVEDQNLIELCLDLVKESLEDSEITSECLSTLSRLCVRAEYCQEAVDKGALKILNDILVSFPDNAILNRQDINLLKTISGNDRVKDEVMKIGCGELVVRAMVQHKNSASVCEAGCGAVSMLALRVPAHAKQLVQFGADEAVVQAMKTHPDNKQIQKLGCMAVRNLVSRCPENRLPLIECQVEEAIHLAIQTFDNDVSLKDVAKAALRDLDLKVKLEEQWKGTGAEIER